MFLSNTQYSFGGKNTKAIVTSVKMTQSGLKAPILTLQMLIELFFVKCSLNKRKAVDSIAF